jgi:outer membrane protein OmpA-like peptidoglycan-associated protein
MKKIFFFLIIASGSFSAIAQQGASTSVMVDTPKPKKSFTGDSLLPRFVVDVNLLLGALSQNITTANTSGNYSSGVNMNTNGNLNFTNGLSYGFDGQVGFFFGEKRNWGIGAGFMYLFQQGDVTLNSFHAEYKSTDEKGNAFRQVITADNPIKEHLQITNLNVPLVLKYKKRFSKLLGFTADAGVLFNVKESSAFSTNASFDYEAIYAYNSNGTTYYDNSVPPKSTDVLYTKASYNQSSVHGTVGDYFNYLHQQGYNVGLGVSPNNNSGTVTYSTGGLGFLLRPAINFFLSDAVALNVGVFYMYQSVNNTAQGGYQLTNKTGEYSSVLNTVTNSVNQSFGGNVGVRFFVGKRKEPAPPLTVTYVDATNPSVCGMCDGTLTLHGLFPNQPVTVNYNLDGAAQPAHTDVVSAQGTVTLSHLCAGSYSGIVATVGSESAMGEAKTLVNPSIGAISVSSTSPSQDGKCDGSITIHGLAPRTPVKVYYDLNGAAQPAFSGTPGADGTVTLNGLCAGTYTKIVVGMNTCSAKGKDITLISMTPAAVTSSEPVFDELHKISAPILFEVNKTVIQKTSEPTLDEAVRLLNQDKTSYIIVDGYTDISGRPAYNKVLSVKRAKAVKKKLEDMGVDPKRIKIEGHGSKDPVGDNKTLEGRKENRRAVMHLNVGE